MVLSRWSRRLGGWPRRVTALFCLVLAGASALSGRAHKPRLETVVVTTRGVAAGALITAPDVSLARWPAGTRPASALTATAAVVGRRAGGPIEAGEAITSARLVGTALTAGLATGLAAVPVRLADSGSATLIRAGDFADLLVPAAADGAAPVVVARQVLVLAVLPASTTAEGAELIVAVDEAGELRLAAVLGREVFASVRPPP